MLSSSCCSANRTLLPDICRARLHEQLPEAKVLTVLQNVDALYWRAAGERADKVEAVRVSDDVVCVFNATPLEKYESYRLFLDQWSRCDGGPDFAPTIYNLIDSLAQISRHQPLFAAQRHAAEVPGRPAAGGLRQRVGRDPAPPAGAPTA